MQGSHSGEWQGPWRDIWAGEFIAGMRPHCPPKEMVSENFRFMLYTSGSTGKPKDVAHCTAGYLPRTSLTARTVFALQAGDCYAPVTDVGWIAGHSYIIYGHPANGVSTFMSKSVPPYPKENRNGDGCDAANNERRECGHFGINEYDCMGRGCCWRAAGNGVPWCFERTGPTPAPWKDCAIPDPAKQDCGFMGVTRRMCEATGCCWVESRTGAPWCFKSTNAPAPRPPTGGKQCGVADAAKQDCGFMGVTQDTCESKGCCWAESRSGAPWCFKDGDAPTPKPPQPYAPTGGERCQVGDPAKQDCGFMGVNQESCEGRGCCWAESSTGAPWCFKDANAPTPPPPTPLAPGDLPGCELFTMNRCEGSSSATPDKYAANRWYTPLEGEEDYIPTFQDYGRLVAHAHVTYKDPSLSSATLAVVAQHSDPSVGLTYVLGGAEQREATKDFSSASQEGPLTIQVKGDDGSSVELEPVDFHWTAPPVLERLGDYRGGQKGAVVELFGWPHADIEKECADLARMGYMGVKLFPVHEQVLSGEPMNDVLNPWYFMYQPVSYRLAGRMGSRSDLRKMIHACRSVGVRVYADAVLNHMTGSGNDANTKHRNPQAGCAKWGNKSSSLSAPDASLGAPPYTELLTNGHSPFYTQGFTYTVSERTGQNPLEEYPAVPYGPLDFHCEKALSSWNDPEILNSGWLSGLVDLDTSRENVQMRIADYITDLLGIGFSGIRIDAAKHIRPDDLVGIFSKVKANMGGQLPGDFISWLEILLGGEADLLMCNDNSGYNYGNGLVAKLKAAGFSGGEAEKVKTWNAGYPKEPEHGMDGCSYGRGLKRQVIQNDDHDEQNPGSSSRDMGPAGCVLIKGCSEDEHRGHEIKLFSNPPGAQNNAEDYPIRLVLSSFYWGTGGVAGMPDGLSDCSLCTSHCERCQGMPYVPAHDPSSKGYDKGDGQYTRVHRDTGIVNAMRAWMGLGAI